MSICRCNPFHINKHDVTALRESELQAMGGPKTSKNISSLKGQMLDKRKFRESKLGHRRVAENGQITFKKIQTSQIMGSIQLGIGHAVNSLASKLERDLLMLDFMIVETVSFPRDGSSITPAHRYSNFKFKSYAPVAFRYFRDLFGIKPDDYLLSLCKYPLKELTNSGASGSIFYVTDDGEFIIKTVQHREADFLKRLLPGYYMNLHENPRTLLPKYFGLYCYICDGKNIRLVVMNNLLPTSIKIHKKYDLKGSTYRRKASEHEKKKTSPTLKDLDFIEHQTDGIKLEPRTYNALIKTITRDCRVLESFDIIDYSLLVGIHNVDTAKQEKLGEKGKKNEGSESIENMSNISESDSFLKSDLSFKKNKLINKLRLTDFSTAMESIDAEIRDSDEDEDTPAGGIPAKNAEGERLLLFLGIIDILQSFRIKKKLEHVWKSLLYDGDTVSVHRPEYYAQRFQGFMGKTVFKKAPALKYSSSKRKGVLGKHRLITITETEALRNYHLPKIPEESEYTHEEGLSTPAPCYIIQRKLHLSNFSNSERTASVCDAEIKSCSNLNPPSAINPWTTSNLSWFHCTVTGGDMQTENLSAHFNFISP